MSLGARVRYYREKREWTLEDLAERSTVDVGTISALENRNSQRSRFTGQLAKAFGLTIEQLLDESRDWLASEVPANVHSVEEARARYRATRWLFSDELFEALRHRKKRELDIAENVLRAHLQLPALPSKQAKRGAV
jgi:transcriptional regulator with XRE-family HTH domain